MTTSTGRVADHRLPLRSSDVEAFARQLAAAVGVSVPAGAKRQREDSRRLGRTPSAQDLAAHKGSSIVIAGEQQPPFVHALAHAMNAALGNVGKTVTYTESIEANPVNQIESLRDLVNDLNAGQSRFAGDPRRQSRLRRARGF